MNKLSLTVDCPACATVIKRSDLARNLTAQSTPKNKQPVSIWQALSSPDTGLHCPNCKVALKPKWVSFWPLLLLLPALLSYQLLPIVWATGCFVLAGLMISIFIRFGTQYDEK